MPANKDALIRFRVINRCLKNKYKPYPKLDELIQACEDALGKPISIRTIQSDLQAMRYDSDLGYNAPIVYDAKNGGYTYEDINYSIDNIPLNEDDLNTLEFATKVLEQFKNVDFLKPFSGIIDKISSSYEISRHVEKHEQNDVIEFESAPTASGKEYINDILKAIKDQKVLEISYKSFKDEKSRLFLVHPYLLKEYKYRWYLIGYSDEKKNIITLGLDRIQELKENEKYFELKKGFESKQYFSDAFGITAPQKINVKEVVLKFSPEQGQYIKSQAMHHSQMILKDNKKEFRISLNVMISYELKAQILSYGSSVEVVKPKSLRLEMSNEIKKMKENYK